MALPPLRYGQQQQPNTKVLIIYSLPLTFLPSSFCQKKKNVYTHPRRLHPLPAHTCTLTHQQTRLYAPPGPRHLTSQGVLDYLGSLSSQGVPGLHLIHPSLVHSSFPFLYSSRTSQLTQINLFYLQLMHSLPH